MAGMPRVNRTDVVFFTSADWREARKAAVDAYDSKVVDPHFSRGDSNVIVYYDDEHDHYVVMMADANGNMIRRHLRTFEDVSHQIWNMLT